MGSPSFYTQLDKRNKYILKCCFFVFAVNGLYAMILGSLLPLISSEYGLNNTVSGALLSAHQVGNLIAGFIAGVLPIYLGRKKSILFLCSFVVAIGALTSPFLVIACTNMAGDRGWKIAAGVIIFLAIISMVLFSQMKIDDVVKSKENTSYQFLKFKHFWIVSGILFFYLCAEAAINGWIVKYFIDSDIMTREYAQMLASLLWVVILAGRLTCAFIVDKISKKTLLLVTSIGTVAFYLLLLSTQNILVITIAIMGLGFSMAGIYPTTVSTFGSTIKLYPMSMGALLMLSSIGSILMPIIVGSLSDNWGIWAGMSAIVIAIVMMLVFVLINVFHVRES